MSNPSYCFGLNCDKDRTFFRPAVVEKKQSIRVNAYSLSLLLYSIFARMQKHQIYPSPRKARRTMWK